MKKREELLKEFKELLQREDSDEVFAQMAKKNNEYIDELISQPVEIKLENNGTSSNVSLHGEGTAIILNLIALTKSIMKDVEMDEDVYWSFFSVIGGERKDIENN